MRENNQTGFTIMELMIVIAIIGILVMIAVPSYQIYTRRAYATELVNAAAPYKLGVEECFQVTGELTDCAAGRNGVPPAFASEEGNIKSVTVDTDGTVHVIPHNKHGFAAQDDYLIQPRISQHHLIWSSQGGAVVKGYLK